MQNFLFELSTGFPILIYAFGALYILLVIILALAVLRDARIRQLTNRGTFLVGPWVWSLIIVVTDGFSGALAYWLIHYSALRYVSRDPAA